MKRGQYIGLRVYLKPSQFILIQSQLSQYSISPDTSESRTEYFFNSLKGLYT